MNDKPEIFLKNDYLHEFFDFVTWIVNISVFCYIYDN